MVTNNSTNEGTAASGKVLQGQGIGTASAFSTATYPSTAGTSGKVLISDGTNIVSSTPTFPNASATSRKIIVSDGTNWVASTETWATPSTSGNVLTSDGTNWTSAIPTFLIATKTLTSSQIKNIHATPIEIIPAPGSGKGIIVVAGSYKFTYGGSNVFVAGASQTIVLRYNNTVTSIYGVAFVPNAIIVGSTTQFSANNNNTSNLTAAAAGVYDNVNVAAYNSVATEISGNAANDNTIDIILGYYIITY